MANVIQRRRPNRLTVCFSDEELALINETMKLTNKTMSGIVRSATLEKCQRIFNANEENKRFFPTVRKYDF